jgi:cytochrome P450
MYQAGVDTTQTTIAFCILSLLANPHMIKNIQAEIDSFTHGSRLPDFEDEEQVPYLKAFIKEALRYWSFIPSPIPRCLAVDDEYKGYRFPAGSLIMPNTWAMLHNKDVFVDPFTFNPERFISGENLKEINAHYSTAWGYGRRICPGRHMAASTVWITLAQILAVYDIEKSTDKGGRVIEPKMELSSFGITLAVFPFQCSFIPRSESARKLILSANDDD